MTSGAGTRVMTADQTITVTVTNADEGRSGTVTIDDTTPTVGDELTASTANAADPDGLPDPFAPAWQWYRTPDGGSETEISGETSATYTVVAADLGATLTAKASWTDKGGFANTLASAATSAVAAASALPTLSIADAEGDEGDGVEFTATLTAAAAADVTATWTASIGSGDTASAADLATTKTGPVTVAAGDVEAKFTVPVNDDTTDEPDQTFTLTLSGVSSNAQLGADPTAEGTIEDDDPAPTVTVAAAAATEGDKVAFAVTLSAVSGRDVEVGYATSVATGDTAVSGTDFTAATGTLTIPATDGTDTGTVEVQTTQDSTEEEDETFTLTLSATKNVDLGTPSTATGTINDDDGTPANCTLNTGDVWCGVVTVGTETNTGGATTGHGFSSITGASFGTLTDDSGNQTFTYGTETYAVSRVVVAADFFAGELAFRVQHGSGGVLTDDDRAKLALHVDGSPTPFAFRDTAHSARLGYVWTNSGLDWSSATPVTVRLRELPDAPTGFEAAVGDAQVPLTWDEPASGANITRHEFRYQTGDGSYPLTWTQIPTSAPGGTNEASFTVTGLTNEIAHTFELRAVNDSGGSAAVEDGPVTPTPGICDRTEQVRDAIIYYLGEGGVTRACAAVNVADLASLTAAMEMAGEGISSLKAGDFAGLTSVGHLDISDNDFTTLPANVFTGLTSVEAILMGRGTLSSLDAGAFTGLTSLARLDLNENDLTSLDARVFSGLMSLGQLTLQENDLDELDAELFSGLTSLVRLNLADNDLEELPPGVFNGLSSLIRIFLDGNDLEELPAGVFSGFTALSALRLGDNPDSGDVLPLTVTVEKVGTDQARAEVPAGAPFTVEFTAAVVNGSLPASDTKLAVALGSVEGTAVTVTRTSGTTAPVTVDIDLTTQPSLPANHTGYEFAKATSGLPKEILSEDPNEPPVFDPPTAEREVPENSAAGTDVGDPMPEATDEDTGDTLEYSLEGDDARFFDFDASTRQITTRANATYNHEAAKNEYEVKVRADDGRDSATLAVTIRLTDVAERPAKPEKPTLSPISGSSTSLMASWVKPGRNGGPDITGYNVQYKLSTASAWTDFAHDGTRVSTTITGLTAGASYQVRVQAENGELDSAWSEPSDAAVPNPAAGVLPRITAVRVTSVPELERDTYGRGETIRFTVYFSAPVMVTGSPHFTFSLGNRNDVEKVDAPYESGSGTAALVFGYVVREGDEDDNGIFLVDSAAFERTGRPPGPVGLDAGEAITALGGGLAADLSSSERGNQRDHKVDGSRALEGPAPTVMGRLKVTSWPVRGDGVHALGDTILFTLPLSEPVRVEGQPQPALAFELGGGAREARYWGLTDTEHEMGSPPPEPRPEGVKLHFGYTVKAGDRDDDGVSVAANAISLGGARVRSTVTGFDADLTHAAVGPFSDHRVDAGTETVPAAAGVTILDTDGNELPETDGTPRLVIPEGGQGRYGLKLNTRPAHLVNLQAIQSDGDEDLAVLPNFTQPSIAPDAWERPSWVDIAAAADADSENGERIFQNVVHSRDPAYNDLVLPNVVVVEADDDPAPTRPPPPEITAVAMASEPRLEADTYGYGETIRFRVEFSERVTVGGTPHFTFSLGNRNAARRVDSPYESGNRTSALVFAYEVQRGDEDDNGIFLLVGRDFTDRAGPVGLGRGGAILAVQGGVAADLAHDTGRGAQRGHRVDGSRPEEPVPAGPTVDSLAVNSWPQSGGDAYRADDPIVFTVTFSEKVQVEGQPTLAFDLGGQAREAGYHGLTDDDYVEGGPQPRPRPEAAKMHFAYTVQTGDVDDDGVSVGANAIRLDGATVRSAATELDADLAHAATGPLSDPVDAAAGSPATTAEPLTAEFRELPPAHDGETAFTFRLAFSEDVAVSAAALRDHALTVTGGTVTDAARVDGRADRWSIAVTPSGREEVLISLPPERDCAAAGAVCTADGRPLSTGLAQLVAGPPNSRAEGRPEIAGTAQVGETLSASTSDITDADGLDNAAFAHQWLRGGADIPGATGASYTAVEADAGERLKVRVAFADDAGHAESLTSAATDAVAARANAPARGAPTIAGTARVGETLAASTSGIADADGLDNASFAHQWLRGGADIPGATGATYTAVEADAGERLKVRVEFEDDAGHAESLTSAATDAVAARPANTPAEGRPEIAGKEQVGETLTASTSGIADADGLDSAAFAHQWLRDGADIPGATGASYTAVEADAGERLKVRVDFEDDAGHAESLTSRSTGRVAARPLPKASVADARVLEAAGATLDFAVTLSAPPPGPVTVDYRTLDASATAGEDYEAAEGTLSFAAGETAKTLRVTVLDDDVDEGDEKMVLVLDPGPGVARGDRLASGTIENSDPLPAAWLVRFGRAASDHAVEAVEARFRDPGGASHATFGGRRLWGGGGLFDAPARGMPGDPFACGPFGGGLFGTALDGGTDPDGAGRTLGANAGDGPGNEAGIDCGTSAGMPPGVNGAMGAGVRGGMNGGMGAGMNAGTNGVLRGPPAGGGHLPNLRDLLLGSSFRLSAGGKDGGGAPRRLTAWGGASATRFDGVADGVSVDGETATFLVGADAAWNRWLAGITVAHSIGAGGFRGGPGGGAGELDSTLTAVHPYARWRADDRLSAWGVLGYGAGDLTLETNGAAWETDTSMRMAAGGLRGVFLRGAGGLELAAKTDLRVTRIASDGVDDNAAGLLAAAAGGTSRLRLLLEGSRPFRFGAARMLTPTLALGVRRDGGDAETGAGIDLGGSLRYADAGLGLVAEASGRYLAAHEDGTYREWGASASVRIDPGTPGRGLTLAVMPTWGASATGGAERLWSVRDARGLGGRGFDAAMRLRAEAGYGLSAFKGNGSVTPFAGLSTAGPTGRDWRFGAQWTRGAALRMSLEATRRESPAAPPAHGISFRLTWTPGARGPSPAAAARAAGDGPRTDASCPADGMASGNADGRTGIAGRARAQPPAGSTCSPPAETPPDR